MIGERIKSLREKLGQSQEELANAIAMHPNTVARWERKELAPRGTSLSKLATALETTTGYLLGETDDPRRYDKSASEERLPQSNVRPVRGGTVDVPVLSMASAVCCGPGFDICDVEAEVDWWEPVPERWLLGVPRGPKTIFITHVEGDSMEPMIEDGERVLINPNLEVKHGDIALVRWNGRSMVRGIKFERDRSVRLCPANTERYNEDLVSVEDIEFVLEFCGVVMRFLGKDRVSRGIL